MHVLDPEGWRPPRPRVGLLGGSFNPAHAGHRHISEVALRRLQLDEVWWLVSPQNPLKPVVGMAPLPERLGQAAKLAHHPRIHVTAIEARLGTQYTADTLAALKRRFPRVHFVWLMGADNLIQLPRWERWSSIFHSMPIAVFARSPYYLRALVGKAAIRFRRYRRRPDSGGCLARMKPPAWMFLHLRLHPASATRIRAEATSGGPAGRAPPPDAHATPTAHAKGAHDRDRQAQPQAGAARKAEGAQGAAAHDLAEAD